MTYPPRFRLLAGLLAPVLLALIWSCDAFSQQRASAARRGTTAASPSSRGPNVVSAPFGSMLVSSENFVSPLASLLTATSQPSSSEERRSYFNSSNRAQLLNVPEMFGDFRRGGPSILIDPTTNALPALQSEFPIAAAVSGLRVAENNRALPAHRAWVAYNYFDSAFDVSTDNRFSSGLYSRSQSLHRSTIAVETLLDEGQTSVEVRMPFGAAFNSSGEIGVDHIPLSVASASVGNLNVLLKRLLYADGARAVSAGLGIEAPTGSDGVIRFGDITATLDPEATHFVPFVALTQRHGCWFGHGFMQLDVASQGDPLNVTLTSVGVSQSAGRIDQPPLLGIDLGGGYWLIPPCDCGKGLAVVGEIHYTTPLADSDAFSVPGALTSVAVNSPTNAAYDVLNFTAGLQLALAGGWRIRPAVVVPAKNKRVFDAEYLMQVNRSF